MREIKFRVWDKEYKNWREIPDLYGDYQANAFRTYGKPFSIFSFFNTDVQERLKSGEIIVQEFTGLKDKNGKEIYEGDILRERNNFGETFSVVEFNTASFAVKYLKGNSGLRNLVGFFSDCTGPIPEHLEVIGNIFENPIDK